MRPELETLRVTGEDRSVWLNGLLTCDVSDLGPGAARWGLALTKQGKILSEALVLGSAEALYVGISAGTAGAVGDWFDSFLIMEDAELSDASRELTWVLFYGAGSSPFANAMAGAHQGWLAGEINWSPGVGAVLVLPRPDLEVLLDRVRQDAGLELASEEIWQAFRVRHLLPLFGVDYTDRQNPHEASLDRRAVSWTKGCYLGQEAVCMQDMRGKVKWRLVSLELDGGDAATEKAGAPVSTDDGVIGEVTSLVQDPEDGRWVALARVRAKHAQRGTRVRVGSVSAVVVESPSSS